MPICWEDRIVLYVGYLFQKNKKSSTIRSYLSAIRAVLKAEKVELNEDLFLLTSLIRACKLKNDQIHTRLSITRGLLDVLLRKTNQYFREQGQVYLAALYCSLFSTAYYGLLRVGELTSGSHPVFATDVQIADNKKKIKLIFHTSKTHWHGDEPQIIIIKSTAKTDEQTRKNVIRCNITCSYYLMKRFSDLHPTCSSITEPLFVFRDKTPVQPHHMRNVLKLILHIAGFDETLYDTHSLRISTATSLLNLGISVETIKKLGRWKSNSVYKYLR